MKKLLILIGAIILAISALEWQHLEIKKLRVERDRYQHNTEVLTKQAEAYKVSDSLNACRVEALELTAKEFEKMCDDDTQLILELKGKNRDLEHVNKAKTEQIYKLKGQAKDTTIVIHNDTTLIAKCIKHSDKWIDVDLCVCDDGSYNGQIKTKDYLIITETIRYKRFLGFLWKTKKIKDRRFDVVSKNPHSSVIDFKVTKIVR